VSDQVAPTTWLVVPCFNEAARLDRDGFFSLLDESVGVVLVDDGSTDDTAEILRAWSAADERVACLILPRNQGKGEAVRAGLRWALDHDAAFVGYIDADLATPPSEVHRLLGVLRDHDDLAVVMGSRVMRLGSALERQGHRHFTGRLYATAASYALNIPVYDTQCGAKFFRVTPTFRHAVASPFGSRWSFDVRLLQRLLDGAPDAPGLPLSSFYEVPLNEWRDVAGSKVRLVSAARAFAELWPVARTRRRSLRR